MHAAWMVHDGRMRQRAISRLLWTADGWLAPLLAHLRLRWEARRSPELEKDGQALLSREACPLELRGDFRSVAAQLAYDLHHNRCLTFSYPHGYVFWLNAN